MKMRSTRVIICVALAIGCAQSQDEAETSASQQAIFSSPQLWPLSMGNWDYLADVTGDGKSDAILRVGTILRFSESTGTSFQEWPATVEWLAGYDYKLADVSGDGQADIIGVGPSGDIMVALSMGSYIASGTVWNYWSPSYDHQFADVNGDGKADIIGVGPSGDIMVALSTGSAFASGSVWQYWSSQYDHRFADVNGDGKADAIGVARSSGPGRVRGDIVVALSNGTSFVGPALTWANGASYYEPKFMDADGDGKGDVLGLASGSLHVVQVGRSTGSAFSASETWGTTNTNGGAAGAATPTLHYADVNGDGKLDMLTREPSMALVHLGN